MKKIFLLIFVFVFTFGVNISLADVNAVTPSTNEINQTNGWAHFNVLDVEVGHVDLELVNPRSLWSCFEYRTDGDTTQKTSDINPNSDIVDGRYPSKCLNNNTSSLPLDANEYIEIRMVFGGETDERFDWTRFDVLPRPRVAEITSPATGEEVSGLVEFAAYLDDDDVDGIQWAVRKGTCAAGVAGVFGNVGGRTDVATIDTSDLTNQTFSFIGDMTGMELGSYCFVYNPREDGGESNIRVLREFVLIDTISPLVTIEGPIEGDVVSGSVEIFGTVLDDYTLSHYNISVYPGDADFTDFSQRIVSQTVYQPNGFTNENILSWDSTAWDDGEYLIRLAARDAARNIDFSGDAYLGGDDSQHVIMVTVNNYTENKDECKNDGWKLGTQDEGENVIFKNQGDCVSYFQSDENAKGNKKNN